MTSVSLPDPVIRRPEPRVDATARERALRERVGGEVRFDAGSRGAYSTDASNYRQVPIGVVVPRTVDDAAAAIAVCREHGAPVVSRGGGTSLAPHRLMFGPKPATHDHCTLGGMIGNNSCGATAQAYGKTVGNVLRLEVLTYDGERFCGYNLDWLLPEQGFDVARALTGSESTLVTILHAELRLVPEPAAQALVVLGYPDIASAADAAPRIAPHRPEQLEGLDGRLITFERERRMNPEALRLPPEGGGWLMVISSGDSQDEADAKARALIDDLRGTEHEPTVRFGYSGSALYGHFGLGCVHTRIPFDLVTAEGIATFRRFIERAADLVVSYGGSFSGEHGDGQSRGELLPKMFGEDLVRAFGQFKAVFDPGNLMNPGQVVAPYRIDENLRLGTSWVPRDYDTYFDYPDDDGRFERAVMRCVGVGKCRRVKGEGEVGGGVMCPSYMVTREEEDSTRGRSRLLFEMLEGHADSPVTAGWRSTEVRDALDLCPACKGGKKDCPAGVDVATMKAEFLAHHYVGQVRPRSHYSMGWLPAAAQLASRAPRLVNALTQAPILRDVLTAAGGIDRRRRIPLFAGQTLQAWAADRDPGVAGLRGGVVL